MFQGSSLCVVTLCWKSDACIEALSLWRRMTYRSICRKGILPLFKYLWFTRSCLSNIYSTAGFFHQWLPPFRSSPYLSRKVTSELAACPLLQFIHQKPTNPFIGKSNVGKYYPVQRSTLCGALMPAVRCGMHIRQRFSLSTKKTYLRAIHYVHIAETEWNRYIR